MHNRAEPPGGDLSCNQVKPQGVLENNRRGDHLPQNQFA